MGKNRKKETHASKVQPEKERFPGWLVWPVFLFWFILIFKNYYGKFTPDLGSLFVILSPEQYSMPGFGVLYGHLANLAAALAFMFANFSLGRLTLRFSGFRFLNPLEETVFSTGFGIGLLSVFVFLLGIFKLLYFWAVALPLCLLLAAGIADLRRHPFTEAAPERLAPGFGDIIAFSILFFAMGLNLLGALSPEIFYDSLVYHLAVPNFYAIKHRITLMPYNTLSNLPLTHGMIYLAALLVKGVGLAKLVNFSALALAAAAIAALGMRYFSWRAGLWAALIFCTIFQAMSSAWGVGTETWLAFFGMLALYSVMLRNSSGERRWLWLAAVFSGLSMGVKYTGLFTAVGVMLVYAFSERKNLSAALRDLAVFTLIASLFVGPWLVKNYIYTGNPAPPMLTGIFKSDSHNDPEKLKAFLMESRQMREFRVSEWLKAPWNITMGKVANSEYFTPLFLFILPFCFLLAAPAGAALLSLWLYFLVVWLGWSGASTMVRFFMPGYPAAGLLIGVYLFSGTHTGLKSALRAVVLAACLTGLYWSTLVFYSQGRWKPVSGQITADEYLTHTRQSYPYSHYSGIKFINEKLPADSKTLIVGDGRSFYMKKDFVASSASDKAPLVEYSSAAAGGSDLYARLKADGFTHILLNVAEGARLARDYRMFDFDARSLAVFAEFWASHVREVFSFDETQGGQAFNKIGVYELVGKRAEGDAPPFDYISVVIAKHRK